MFADFIREAKNEQEVFFLLTSYVESVRYGDQLNLGPETVTRIPLGDNDRVREQGQQLAAELNKASATQNENACLVIAEALPVFNAALDRLEALTRRNPAPATA